MTVTEKSAGVVVFLKKSGTLHYLLLRDNEDQWTFAKGQLEEGEKDLTAAIRELEEETGVSSLRILPGFKRTIRYRYNRGTTKVEKTVVFFLGESGSSEFHLSSEHMDAAWLSREDAAERIAFSNLKQLLLEADAFILAAN
jgi:8-oxo-dGTP pyrophosphatase MutT (NUDIX family)